MMVVFLGLPLLLMGTSGFFPLINAGSPASCRDIRWVPARWCFASPVFRGFTDVGGYNDQGVAGVIVFLSHRHLHVLLLIAIDLFGVGSLGFQQGQLPVSWFPLVSELCFYFVSGLMWDFDRFHARVLPALGSEITQQPIALIDLILKRHHHVYPSRRYFLFVLPSHRPRMVRFHGLINPVVVISHPFIRDIFGVDFDFSEFLLETVFDASELLEFVGAALVDVVDSFGEVVVDHGDELGVGGGRGEERVVGRSAGGGGDGGHGEVGSGVGGEG